MAHRPIACSATDVSVHRTEHGGHVSRAPTVHTNASEQLAHLDRKRTDYITITF